MFHLYQYVENDINNSFHPESWFVLKKRKQFVEVVKVAHVAAPLSHPPEPKKK